MGKRAILDSDVLARSERPSGVVSDDCSATIHQPCFQCIDTGPHIGCVPAGLRPIGGVWDETTHIFGVELDVEVESPEIRPAHDGLRTRLWMRRFRLHLQNRLELHQRSLPHHHRCRRVGFDVDRCRRDNGDLCLISSDILAARPRAP